MERAVQWLRTPRAVAAGDVLAVAVVLSVGLAVHLAARSDPGVEARPLTVGVAVLAAAAAVALWWRRDHPLLVLGAVVVLAVVAGAGGDGAGLSTVQLALEVALVAFAAGAWAGRPALPLGVLGAVGVLVVLAAWRDGSSAWSAAAFVAAVVALPAVAGLAARARRRYVEEVERRLVEAERDRDERARVALAEERTRIARELHDVVAHHVSLIGVQAGAARTALDRSPELARASLAGIETASREAVAEMRRLLDVLRPAGAGPATVPPPGLDDVDALVARWRDAGLAVELDRRGPVGTLAPALSLSALRIVEEALTNVARHCAAGRAAVTVDVGAEAVTVSVVDPGPPSPSTLAAPPGRGLTGMAERVALYGGELVVGPVAGGGFCVWARLPRRWP